MWQAKIIPEFLLECGVVLNVQRLPQAVSTLYLSNVEPFLNAS